MLKLKKEAEWRFYMKIYDISQEVFSCEVYPGDPTPESRSLMSILDGDVCNLSELKMCAHNGTHIDAPYHFFNEGKTVDKIELKRVVGMAFVYEHSGVLTYTDAEDILLRAEELDPESSKRILIKGDAVVSSEAAKLFADRGVYLLGNESQTVGPADAPREVHLILLGKDVVLLEGIRLAHVPEGVYFLNAVPLSLANADGAPCRAILIDFKE